MFWSAMAPLREAGRLGMLAFQFPPYFVAKAANFDYVAELPERLPGAPSQSNFRHPSWVRDETGRTDTITFLRIVCGLRYAPIEAPEDSSIVLSFIQAMGDQVYVRFRGKKRENWFKRNITAAERFKYLYSERELQSLPKGSAIWSKKASTSARTRLQPVLSEFWNHERSMMAAIVPWPGAIARAGESAGLPLPYRSDDWQSPFLFEKLLF